MTPIPSTRVSELISRFQQAEGASPTLPVGETAAASARLPHASQDSSIPSRSHHSPNAASPPAIPVRSGSVGERVQRFSAHARGTPAPPSVGRAPKVADEPAVQQGKLGDMDWSDRTKSKATRASSARPAAASPASNPTPSVQFAPRRPAPSPPSAPSPLLPTTADPLSALPRPTPAAAPAAVPSTTSLHCSPPRHSQIRFKPRRQAPAPPPLALELEGKPAQTVLVPATVSSDPQEGRTRYAVGMKEKSGTVEAEKEVKVKEKAEPSPEPALTAVPSPTPSPLESARSHLQVKRKPPPNLLEPVTLQPPSLPNKNSSLEPAAVEHPLAPLHPSPELPSLPPTTRPSSLVDQTVSSPFNDPTPDQARPLIPPSSPVSRPQLPSSPSQTSSTHPLLSRPSLPHASTSLTTSSTRTQHLPAFKLFAPNADPLVLPAVDRLMRETGRPATFSESEDKSLKWGEGERRGWDEWVRGKEPRPGLWGRFRGALKLGQQGGGRYIDLEKSASVSTPSPEQAQRALIFPPMHLLPTGMTVTDLKRNERTPMAAVGLQSVLTTALNGALAAAGSTFGIELTRVEMFRDLMQMISLLTLASSADFSSSAWYRTLFVTIPAAISLDFVSAFGKAIIWLWVFNAIAALAVYEVWRFSRAPKDGRFEGEGVQERSKIKRWRNSYGWKIATTFIATSLYLPLSKLAISALVWTSDYWPVPNPYLASDSPAPAPLGPSDTFYEPLNFCYRTTMLRPAGILGLRNFNWAYIILPVAALTVGWLTIFLPWRLYRLAVDSAPVPDHFTELGERRKDLNVEYQRLIDRDRSPFSFLYREYRRPWAAFKATYMGIKLINVLLIVIVQRENCLFRSQTSVYLGIVRQGCLVAFMGLFLLHMWWSQPFIDPISNRSDLVSRIGYVAIAVLGLLVALDVKGKDDLGGPVLIFVNVVVYAIDGYFAIIGFDFVQRLVKRLQYRIDTSIDLFSPDLDLSKHLSRRIWHETLSTIILAGAEYKMADDAKLDFLVDPGLPPYLIDFRGSVAERYVEDLKILREIGLDAYDAALQSQKLPDNAELNELRRTIQRDLAGVDVWFCLPQTTLNARPGVTTYFGRLDIIPFPFTAILRYDQDPSNPLVLTSRDELSSLVAQNHSAEVTARRKVRLDLRALEGQTIVAPHTANRSAGKRGGVEVSTAVRYHVGTISIGRNSLDDSNSYNHASGFRVSLTYTDGQGTSTTGRLLQNQRLTLDAAQLGVSDTFALSSSLAKLFKRNEGILGTRLPLMEEVLKEHRDALYRAAEEKDYILSHSFLFDVVGRDDLTLEELEKVIESKETSKEVRELVQRYGASLRYLQERMSSVRSSRIRSWWCLLWDDIWRRNQSIAALKSQPAAFSPHYRTSICYHPMPRADLERFLIDRCLGVKARAYFNPGFLNRIYFYIDEITYSGTNRAIPIHLDNAEHTRLPFADLPSRFTPPHNASRLTNHTGTGTDHDGSTLRPRQSFPFEIMYEPPSVRFGSEGWLKEVVTRRAPIAVMRWLGLAHTMHERRVEEEEELHFDLRRGRAGWELPREKLRKVEE